MRRIFFADRGVFLRGQIFLQQVSPYRYLNMAIKQNVVHRLVLIDVRLTRLFFSAHSKFSKYVLSFHS